MLFLEKILEAMLSWIGSIGLLIIIILIILIWLYYDRFSKEGPLDFDALIGLVLLSFVTVGLGKLIVILLKKKKNIK